MIEIIKRKYKKKANFVIQENKGKNIRHACVQINENLNNNIFLNKKTDEWKTIMILDYNTLYFLILFMRSGV